MKNQKDHLKNTKAKLQSNDKKSKVQYLPPVIINKNYQMSRFSCNEKQEVEHVAMNQKDQKENPMKKYLNYTKTLRLKTLTEVIQANKFMENSNSQQQLVVKQKTVSVKTLSSLEPQYLEQDIQDHIQSSIESQKQTNLDFQTIKISIESFLEIKNQPINDYYELKQKIGEGTYGTVYRAICKKSYEQRAIKILKTKFLQGNQNKYFLAEMNLLSKLQHPAIIRLYNLFKYKNHYYVVMEYCKGGSIVKMFKKMKLKSQKIIVSIMKQLLSALSYLHSHKIVHRDIKLDNIVFLGNEEKFQNEEFSIKIIDFGTAVYSPHKVVKMFPIAGTLSYFAPEVIQQILVDKSDIWSAGVLMIILLTGVPPFKDNNEIMIKKKILTKVLNFTQQPYQTLSKQAKSLLSSMLNKNYKQRISAVNALNHAYFKTSQSQKRPISSINVQKLKNFYMKNNFISVIQSYLSLIKVNQAQRQQLSKLFNQIDIDNSGTIQTSQFMQLMKVYGNNYNQQEITKLIKSIDKDKSGKIDFNEFIIAMYSRQKLFVRQSLNEAFDYFDKEKDGFLQVDDIKNILKGSQNKQIQYFVNMIDTNKDNKISREQFLNYFSKF